MSKVVLDVSMSLDGFVAGPDVRPEAPLGDGGELLHMWMWVAGTESDGGGVDAGARQKLDAMVGSTVIGRRTFDLGLKPWGGTPWPGMPSFVVTHRTRDDLLGDNGGTFCFGGLKEAVRRARDAAGEKNVIVQGADVSRQVLEAGLLDEVHLHLAPVLLGSGTALFGGVRAKLTPQGEALAGTATHIYYRVARS